MAMRPPVRSVAGSASPSPIRVRSSPTPFGFHQRKKATVTASETMQAMTLVSW